MTKAFAYYNEIDPFAAEWLRNLIREGLIADGEVDERSIEDVKPDDLRGYTQCHFFAGIGVWSYALRQAGWPDDRPVWTGSCPCQPFSAAGKRDGFADERHLWPAFFHLIEQCCPSVVFGEQVASKDGLAWLDLVQADLEGAGYAVGAADLCAAGVGAPHIRQRLWWVAERLEHAAGDGWLERGAEPSGRRIASGRIIGGLGHHHNQGLERHAGHGNGAPGRAITAGSIAEAGGAGGLADADNQRREHEQGGRSASILGTAHGSPQQQRQSGDHSSGIGGMDDTASTRHQRAFQGPEGDPRYEARLRLLGEGRRSGGVADADGRQLAGQSILRGAERDGQNARRPEGSGSAPACRDHGGLADAAGIGRERGRSSGAGAEPGAVERSSRLCTASAGPSATGPTNGFWRDVDWLFCRDGKWRPVEPGTFPLAHGAPARVGRLRAYGNAIVAPVAQIFIEACLDAEIFDGACHEAIEAIEAGDAEHV